MKKGFVILTLSFCALLIISAGCREKAPAKDVKAVSKKDSVTEDASSVKKDEKWAGKADAKSGATAKKPDKTPEKAPVKKIPVKTPEQIEAEKKKAEFEKTWQLVFEDDFSNTDVGTRWEFVDGTWAVEKGELVGKGDAAHIAILKQDIVGDVRIEFDVHIDSEFLNDVSCFFSAKTEDPKIKTYGTGYLLQYGGYTNTKNDIMRDGFAMAEEAGSPLKKGQKYHMAAQRKGKIVSYSVDGKEILKAEDTDMFNSADHGKIGLYAWGGDNYYDNVKIYKLKK